MKSERKDYIENISLEESNQLRDKRSKNINIQYESLAKYLGLGYYIAAPLVVLTIFGVMLDRYFDSKPVCTLVLIGLGSVSSLYNVIKLIQDLKKEDATHKH